MPGKNFVALAKSHRKPAPGARLVSDVDPNETLEITIRVRSRSSQDKGALLTSLASQPPRERHYSPVAWELTLLILRK